MGKTFSTGLLTNGIWQDASNNIGIGGSPSGSYKLEVTGTAKVSSTLLVSGALTGSSSATFSGNLSVTGNNLFTLAATNVSARIGEYDAANRICLTANQNGANAQDDATKPSWGLVFNANSTDTAFIGHKAAGGGSAALSALMTMTGTGVTTFVNTVDVAVNVSNSTSGLNLVNNYGVGYGNSLNYYTSTTKFGSIQVESSAANTSEMAFKTMIASTVATRMSINQYGNVGINCDSSNKKLYCQSNNATSSYFAFGCQNGVENIFLIRGDGLINTGLAAYSPYNFSVTPGRPVYVNTSGELGYYTSTRESKININPINNFGIINKLNPVSFNYRIKDENNQYTDEFDKNIFYGLIADEVEKIDSNLVFYDKKEDGTKELKGVYYEQLAPLLIKAIQELSAQNQDLKSRLDKAGL